MGFRAVLCSGEEIGFFPRMRQHEDLLQVTQTVREKLQVAIDDKIFKWRFGSKAEAALAGTVTDRKRNDSFAFDMCLMMYPASANLSYVDNLVEMVHKQAKPGECREALSRNRLTPTSDLPATASTLTALCTLAYPHCRPSNAHQAAHRGQGRQDG